MQSNTLALLYHCLYYSVFGDGGPILGRLAEWAVGPTFTPRAIA